MNTKRIRYSLHDRGRGHDTDFWNLAFGETLDYWQTRHARAAARALLKDGRGYWALLARTPAGEAVGVITLNECAAVYAFGNFGEIAELYVVPEYRSAGVGAELVRAAVEFGKERGWSLLEVGAPEVPTWQRTVDFYVRCGFAVVGPRMTLFLATHDNGIQPPAAPDAEG